MYGGDGMSEVKEAHLQDAQKWKIFARSIFRTGKLVLT